MFSLKFFRQNFFSFAIIFLTIFLNTILAASSKNLTIDNTNALFSGQAVMAIVSIDDQTISLFDKDGNNFKSRISSGQRNYETPVGIYSLLQKEAEHYSNIYDDASMPFMQRITWSGLSLHAGDLPGYPASHGCVRLPYNFAEKIFGLTRLGMRVIVARNEVTPSSLSHPALFQPQLHNVEPKDTTPASPFIIEEGLFNETLMPDVQNWPLRNQQQQHLKQRAYFLDLKAKELGELLEIPKSKIEDLTSQRNELLKKQKLSERLRKNSENSLLRMEWSFRRTKTAKEMTAATNARLALLEKQASIDLDITQVRSEIDQTNAALDAAKAELNKLDTNYQDALRIANEAKLRLLPVSVLVSLKKQRVYVRQGLEQIMETEITIENPDQSIGTHIYTALNYNKSGEEVQWNVVSLPKSQPDLYGISYYENANAKKKLRRNYSQLEPSEAFDALQRVQFPPEVKNRVSEYVWPGSSLIITDEEPHKETGKSTEFIVLISGEPQGGIIKRPRWTPNRYYYNSYWSALFNSSDEDDRRRAERERRRFEKEVRRLEKKRQRYWYD
ncbi:MAG: L,D-transpeptidase family protein [Hyphomicrobium sp.]